MADKLDAEREFARAVVDLFNGFAVPDIATQGDMMAMVAEGRYPVADSRWARFLDAGVTFDADRACEQVEEYEVSHSAALFARCRQTGKTYFTGALARINASWGALSQEAKVAAAKAGLRPPERNPFLNNVAQAVEVLDAMGRCARPVPQACRARRSVRGRQRSGARSRCARAWARASQRRREARCSISSSSTTPAVWCTPPS